MNEEKIIEISEVASSPKRIMILKILHKPAGLVKIQEEVKRCGMKCSSSETYKHVQMLLSHKMVMKEQILFGKYVVTDKGRNFIKALNSIGGVDES